jgi:phosphate/sulfate permease
MPQDGKEQTSTANFLLFVGAIVIGVWFLASVSGFVDSGTSPVYAVFFFVPICGVFVVVVVLVEVVNSLSGSKKNESELSAEDTTSDVDGKKKEVRIKQILVSLLIAIIGFVTFLFTIDEIALFLNS